MTFGSWPSTRVPGTRRQEPMTDWSRHGGRRNSRDMFGPPVPPLVPGDRSVGRSGHPGPRFAGESRAGGPGRVRGWRQRSSTPPAMHPQWRQRVIDAIRNGVNEASTPSIGINGASTPSVLASMRHRRHPRWRQDAPGQLSVKAGSRLGRRAPAVQDAHPCQRGSNDEMAPPMLGRSLRHGWARSERPRRSRRVRSEQTSHIGHEQAPG
jgi:hypothetical protein